MNSREEAEKNLNSVEITDRLKGARYFSKHASSADISLLNKALQKEHVAWIRRALERALNKTRVLVTTGDKELFLEESEHADAVLYNMRAEAVDEVSGTILHEFSAIVGALGLSAMDEIPNYESSATAKHLNQLSMLIDAIRNLKKVAGVPKIDSFDLTTVINESIASVKERVGNINIELAGPNPFIVNAGQAEMQIAIVNGLRNAIEAVTDYSSSTPPKIIINWGRAGVECFLVILDTGSGFSDNPNEALKLGSTSKKDHIGYGLATAQFVMRALNGDVLLSNNPDGGAKFELRWDNENANSVR